MEKLNTWLAVRVQYSEANCVVCKYGRLLQTRQLRNILETLPNSGPVQSTVYLYCTTLWSLHLIWTQSSHCLDVDRVYMCLCVFFGFFFFLFLVFFFWFLLFAGNTVTPPLLTLWQNVPVYFCQCCIIISVERVFYMGRCLITMPPLEQNTKLSNTII